MDRARKNWKRAVNNLGEEARVYTIISRKDRELIHALMKERVGNKTKGSGEKK